MKIASSSTIGMNKLGIENGSSYTEKGNLQKDILIHYGLMPEMNIIDFGCGSGRLAHVLPADYNLDYLGLDVIEELLKYARSKSPKNYKFNIHKKKLTMPVLSDSIDMICAFEVFPLLLHEEIYIYLEDMRRVLKKGGKVIFTFLEFDNHQHWLAFNNSVNDKKKKISAHLNTFIERHILQIWAEKIGFKIIEFSDRNFEGRNYGQSLAVFEK